MKPDSWPCPVVLGLGSRSLACPLTIYVCKSLRFSLLNVLVYLFLVEYPMQLLPNPHSKRSSGTVFRQVHHLALICRSSFTCIFSNLLTNLSMTFCSRTPVNLSTSRLNPRPQAPRHWNWPTCSQGTDPEICLIALLDLPSA